MPITEPGFYDGIPNETYHGHCTPAPALSSSGAKTILRECPAAFWHKAPFNPAAGAPERKPAFDIGNAVHLLTLEPETFEARTARLAFDDYRTKEARDARDSAYAAGLVPLLRGDLQAVRGMRDALAAHPVARHAFEGAVTERSYFWQDAEAGVWRKARPDALPADHRRYVLDLKTSTTAHPDAFAKRVYELGYHLSAAWYCDGIEVIDGERPARWGFVVVEKTPPYLVTACWLDDEAMGWGRRDARRAVELFAWCLDRGHWPGYAEDGAPTIRLPGWAIRELEARHTVTA